MELYEIRRAINQAEQQLKDADTCATQLAALLPGRLRHCGPYILTKLKRELRDFNSSTGKWKE